MPTTATAFHSEAAATIASLTGTIAVDPGRIVGPAQAAARQLRRTGVATVDLMPGDMTRYQLVLVDLHTHNEVPGFDGAGDLAVSLVNLTSQSFLIGTDYLPDNFDVHQAMTSHGAVPANPHTVVVITTFIVALIDALNSPAL